MDIADQIKVSHTGRDLGLPGGEATDIAGLVHFGNARIPGLPGDALSVQFWVDRNLPCASQANDEAIRT